MMDWSKMFDMLHKGVQFAEGLMPVLGAIPGANLIPVAAKAIDAVAEVVQNVQTRVAEGKIVLESHDQAQLQGLLARIQTVNDELADYVDKS
jgi:hypothetical protein